MPQVRSVREWIEYLLHKIQELYDNSFVKKTGDEMTGELVFSGLFSGQNAINTNGAKITGLKDVSDPLDATSVQWVSDNFTPFMLEVDNPLE